MRGDYHTERDSRRLSYDWKKIVLWFEFSGVTLNCNKTKNSKGIPGLDLKEGRPLYWKDSLVKRSFFNRPEATSP